MTYTFKIIIAAAGNGLRCEETLLTYRQFHNIFSQVIFSVWHHSNIPSTTDIRIYEQIPEPGFMCFLVIWTSQLQQFTPPPTTLTATLTFINNKHQLVNSIKWAPDADIQWECISLLLRISERLWEQKVHCPVHKTALLDIMSSATWIQWKSMNVNYLIRILILPSYDSLSDLFLPDFQIKILYAFLLQIERSRVRFPALPDFSE